MAMYRIKQDPDAPLPEISSYPPEEYWREVQPGQERDLDLEEIAQINQTVGEAENEELAPIRPFRSPLLMGILAGFLILAFTIWTAHTMFPQKFDFGILIRSTQLAQDASLAALQQAVVVIESTGGSGSGFNIRSDGLIVTNSHVVDGGGLITITFSQHSGGYVFTAQDPILIPNVDLALIPLAAQEALPTVELSTDPVQDGEHVIFIGNPLGYDWTISEGEVIETIQSLEGQSIYFHGPVHPGSSGSPLFNDQSEVIGVVFAMVGEEDAEQGLAVPISYLISQIEEDGL